MTSKVHPTEHVKTRKKKKKKHRIAHKNLSAYSTSRLRIKWKQPTERREEVKNYSLMKSWLFTNEIIWPIYARWNEVYCWAMYFNYFYSLNNKFTLDVNLKVKQILSWIVEHFERDKLCGSVVLCPPCAKRQENQRSLLFNSVERRQLSRCHIWLLCSNIPKLLAHLNWKTLF